MTMTASTPIVVDAPAKLNLYLHVVGRRADGFHLLDTLMVFAELGDRISVVPADDLSLAVDGPFAEALPEDAEDNLVLRAAHALAEAAGLPAKAGISLTKNLPVSAGLGSGSSDAAATLKALARLWEIPDDAVDLYEVGLGLGADVPACIHARPAFIGGIGEEIEDAPALPQIDLLLVNPGIEVATASVFSARKGGFSPPAVFEASPKDMRDLAAVLSDRDNDLTEGAIGLCSAIETILAAIEGSAGCRLARMSGSGATCFGLFDDRETAERAAEAMRDAGWWCAVTRTTP
ncbi:MAG: 4-(cytidine 5'-diphospho)-2-C-methyl-D-erythritol kinase [Alphaproteobacteria bacterium]|nr:4-(cytidine 5'-diphospho)-2-C-methyl-D-erythritol kinase [Alphaproteobacteria bacterium]